MRIRMSKNCVPSKTKEPPEAVLSRLHARAITAYPLLKKFGSFGS